MESGCNHKEIWRDVATAIAKHGFLSCLRYDWSAIVTLLYKYRHSPAPPPLTCLWPGCNYDLQPTGDIKRKVAIELSLLGMHLHVQAYHSESETAYLVYIILGYIFRSLPMKHSPASTHTAAHSDQAGKQERAVDKKVQLHRKLENNTKVSLKCPKCTFQTAVLKPSRMRQRLAGHEFSNHAINPRYLLGLTFLLEMLTTLELICPLHLKLAYLCLT
jgi:hypothetical protein